MPFNVIRWLLRHHLKNGCRGTIPLSTKLSGIDHYAGICARVSRKDTLNSLFGKLLRINIDGTIPTDNPFYASLIGDLRAIYANGLRNPYRMDKRKSTGEIFMSDVGPQDWEELNQAEPGANY